MKNPENTDAIKDWLGTGTINIFGRPFAGKDTQGALLAEEFDGKLLGGGEILRGSEMPERIKEMMKSGMLIPTDDYIDIVLPYLKQDHFGAHPLILSSVGRWHGEEDGVIEATEQSGHPMKAVIYLDLSEDLVRERWEKFSGTEGRGMRHDDTKEVLEIRLEEYREKTLPVIEFYRQDGLLIEIDGNQTPEKVHHAILSELANRALTSP